MDRLADGLAAASISDPADQGAVAAGGGPSADYLLSVMRAVEGADATIRSQMEENNRLKEELLRKTQQLQRIREDATSQSSSSGVGQERNSVANKMDGSKSFDNGSSINPQITSIYPQNGSFGRREHLIQESMKQKYVDSPQANGAFKRSLGEQTPVDNGGPSQFSTPSSRSLSPNRHRKDGEYDSRLLPVSGMNSNMSWKQDLTVKVKEGEEEIKQLKKHLADYTVKEAQILTDKYMLEKRIAYMRLVLFKHMQEQLIVSEEKLRESRYQITPWHTELSNSTSHPVPTDPPAGKVLVTTSKSSLDIVHQTAYPHVQSPMSSPVQATGDWGAFSNRNHQIIPNEVPTRNAEHDDMGGNSLSSRNQFRTEVPAQVSQGDSHAVCFHETPIQNPPFKGLSRNDILDGSESAEVQNTQEPSTRWGPGDSPNLASGLEDANPSYPYLPTVLEEPGSSFSEAADDDPLPGIEGLQITGEAFPGRELQASGYPINGTTTCNFEWVRHLEDGSVNFIDGARQPSYVVTADDVDTLLAIEVQPLDDRKRKGEFIKVYANEQRKISCDPETKELIKKTLEIGHVTYEVQVQLPIKIPYGRQTEFSIISADGVDYNLKPAENTLLRDTIVLVLRLFKNMQHVFREFVHLQFRVCIYRIYDDWLADDAWDGEEGRATCTRTQAAGSKHWLEGDLIEQLAAIRARRARGQPAGGLPSSPSAGRKPYVTAACVSGATNAGAALAGWPSG
ncbi:uncharacterized protein C2845_PM08G07470 [Panicum miliaceum]|uniref:AIR9-like A9 domain-containing protein n=1 Tax=Panicum miliaceum TaxID=4540 RepID=A0A3L6R290_PANMI|nr:uncharacterized protein C2845_PM08G07470 [Panicum miliaceum]